MGAFDFSNHVLNFVAPALWMAVLVTVGARIFMKKSPAAPAFPVQAAINFAVSVGGLVLGLWFFGRDGKMLTYTGMTLVCTTSQWIMLRGWRS